MLTASCCPCAETPQWLSVDGTGHAPVKSSGSRASEKRKEKQDMRFVMDMTDTVLSTSGNCRTFDTRGVVRSGALKLTTPPSESLLR